MSKTIDKTQQAVNSTAEKRQDMMGCLPPDEHLAARTRASALTQSHKHPVATDRHKALFSIAYVRPFPKSTLAGVHDKEITELLLKQVSKPRGLSTPLRQGGGLRL